MCRDNGTSKGRNIHNTETSQRNQRTWTLAPQSHDEMITTFLCIYYCGTSTAYTYVTANSTVSLSVSSSLLSSDSLSSGLGPFSSGHYLSLPTASSLKKSSHSPTPVRSSIKPRNAFSWRHIFLPCKAQTLVDLCANNNNKKSNFVQPWRFPLKLLSNS